MLLSILIMLLSFCLFLLFPFFFSLNAVSVSLLFHQNGVRNRHDNNGGTGGILRGRPCRSMYDVCRVAVATCNENLDGEILM